MKKTLLPIFIYVFVLLSLNCLLAQQAIVRKNATLRPEPGTNQPAEAKLQMGAKLTLLDPTPEHGYYQVKTQDGKEGWVFSKSIKITAVRLKLEQNQLVDVVGEIGVLVDRLKSA